MPRAALDLSQPRDVHIAERLRGDLMIWLTTVRADGRPHLAAVWFLWDGETFLIFSKPNQKIRNLRENAQVALALDDSHGGADPIVIEGTAEVLPHGEVTPALDAYSKKHAQRLEALKWTPEQMGRTYSEAIRVTPTRFL
ncbi:MAG TPA: pyridoxamine 5'-phosphate oxidase family protein [Ktedonobacterales bacterium]|nr:pyridoxamine 5'-phosphate oxidase family protein [Ktedonobacterales bacterium]